MAFCDRVARGIRRGPKTQTGTHIMAEHKHGEMDITVQEKTFNGFIRMVSRTAIVIVVALILLSLING